MAVGPKDLNGKFKALADELEAKIDDVLKDKPAKGGPIGYETYSLGRSHGYPRPVIDIVIQRYVKAGWAEVKFDHDQMEGDTLFFYYGPSQTTIDAYLEK